jgi:hypothetical protein
MLAGVMPDAYRLCSSCRKEIPFGARYWVCSVSTCNRARIGLYFCSVSCWDAHLGETRHREAWAEERRAPTREEAAREGAEEASPRRVVVAPPPSSSSSSSSSPRPAPAPAPAPPRPAEDAVRDVLVVVSKLKAYVRARSGMNTSDGVVDVLSDHLRRLCDDAIRHAAGDGRKTVMDRDFEAILRG